MKHLKKFSSLLLVASMLLTMIQLPAYAGLIKVDGVEASKAQVILTPLRKLGEGETGGQYGFKPTTLNLNTAKANDTFYLGIRLKDASHIEEIAEGQGIASFYTGFWYNNTYVRPVTTQADDIANEIKGYVKQSYKNQDGDDDVYWYGVDDNDLSYKVEVEKRTNNSVSEATQALQPDGEKLYELKLDIQQNSTQGPFHPTDDELIFIIQFKVAKVPDTPKTVFGESGIDTDYSISFGDGTSSYQNSDVVEGIYIKDVIDYTYDQADIFPKSYDVNFYDSYTAADGETPASYGTKIKEGATGVAGGTTVKDASVTEPVVGAAAGAGIDLVSPNEDGKYFAGWKYIPNGGTPTDWKDDVVINGTSAAEKDGAEIKVYATWADPITVTFHSNYNGNKDDASTDPADVTATQSVAPNGYATAPSATASWSLTGKTLAGWVDSTGADVDLTTKKITEATDFYAKWTDAYTVKFYQYEGSGTEIKTALAYDKSITDDSKRTINKDVLPTETQRGTREGYKFDGWYYKKGTSGTETAFTDSTTVVVDDDVIIYGKWTKQVTVKWYDTAANATAAGETGLLATETVDENTDLKDLENTPAVTDDSENHKHFVKWTTDGTDTKDFTSTSTDKLGSDNLTVYQVWADDYKVSFYKEETDIGTASSAHKITYVNPNVGKKVTSTEYPENPTKSGYGFNKWYVYDTETNKVTTTEFTKDSEVTADTVLLADWTENITITFMKNDGTTGDAAKAADIQITPKTTLTANSKSAPAVTRSYSGKDYKLLGWDEKANATSPTYTTTTVNSTAFEASTTLYAIWGVDEDKYPNDFATLSFDSVGGSTVSPIKVYKGDTITADQMPDNPTKTSKGGTAYTFDGWFEEASLSNTTKITAPITLSDDKTAYAHWSYNGTDKVTVNFNSNGATKAAAPASIVVGYGDKIGTAMPKDPEKDGSTFDGWNSASDGAGTKFDKDTVVDSTFDSGLNETSGGSTTVYAKWAAKITVHYNVNGGTADAEKFKDVTAAAKDTYKNLANDPVRTDYVFVGWNTKQNGSGDFIKAGKAKDIISGSTSTDDLTYGDLPATDAEVTLYAQWAFADSPTGVPGGTENPKDNGVKITFDGNVASDSTNKLTAEAKPKYLYVPLGGTIKALGDGTADMMPSEPTRDKYDFVKWNTRADGTGTDITDAVAFAATLDNMQKDGDKYTITVYAQWKVDDEHSSEKKTLKFIRNFDGKGTASDADLTYEVISGDKLGFVPGKPADPDKVKEYYKFEGWYAAQETDANGKKVLVKGTTSTPFEDKAITEDATYYAKWHMALIAEVQGTKIGDGTEATIGSIYTGSEITPKYKIYRIAPDKIGTPVTKTDYIEYAVGDDKTGIVLKGSDTYTATYKIDNADKTLQDVGTYDIDVSLIPSTALAIGGASIDTVEPDEYTITAAKWTAKVDHESQIQKAGSTVPKAAIEVYDGETKKTLDTDYTVKYYSWTDKNNDKKIDKSDDAGKNELTEVTNPTAVGLYVIEVIPTDTNIEISKVTDLKTDNDNDVLVYGETATDKYPSYAGAKKGQNIIYQIIPSDPSATITAKPVTLVKGEDGKDTTKVGDTDITWYESDYEKERTFDASYDEDDATKPKYWDYYARVDKDTKSIQFTVTPTNKDTTILKAPTAGDGVTISAPDSTTGAWTITVDLTKTGSTENLIAITTAAGSGDSDPKAEYKFHIEKLVEAKIELNYGNSPYGEIERMGDDSKGAAKWDADKIKTVKAEFDKNNKITAANKPDGLITGRTFSPRAWVDDVTDTKTVPTDSNVNMDRNTTAIFVYRGEDFVDPGFTATDSRGEKVEKVKIEATVGVMKTGGIDNIKDANVTDTKLIDVEAASGYKFTELTKKDGKAVYIRPAVYDMTYSFEDPYTKETVSTTRKMVMLWEIGDANVSALVDGSDITYMSSILKKAVKPLNGVTGTKAGTKTASLYYYRILDINESSLFDGSDITVLSSILKKAIPKFRMYRELK